ncbi:MAG: preprotein translocase subunit SecA [Treponema sp.]|nr:MAG: preprotein translocase subunit SecA [Treponema sp.]
MGFSIAKFLFGSQHERDIKALLPLLREVNKKESWALTLTEAEFKEKTEEFRSRYKKGETLESFIPEAYAMAREAARRILGERPYDVQIMGALVLNSGKIVEMKTGEGKTLMSVAAAYLNSLSGKGVHVITVNDYLAERDANWMRPVFAYLGVSVGAILSNMDNDARSEAYACDITYGTNNEFGFDYLRDNMQLKLDKKVQRGFNFAIVDEIDSILIDEARTPLIISGAAEDDTHNYFEVDKLVGQLKEVQKNPETGEYPNEAEGEEVIGDYKIDEKSRRISFSDPGMLHIEEILNKRGLINGNLFDENNFEYIHYFTQAVKAHILYQIDVDYVVADGKVQIVDEFTGRILEGRRYSDGLHQAIEAKEHIRIAQRNRTLATVTFQNFFRMYTKLSGMTGTADTEAVEFSKIYKLDVVVIPTNRPVARIDENDEVYLTETDKINALCDEISEAHHRGQPILVGTASIEKSELISKFLLKRGIRHEVLNAKNHAREALIIAEAGAKGSVTIATNMAGRGTDIKLGGNPEFRARKKAGSQPNPDHLEKLIKEETVKWRNDYEEVKNCGGLYVIGTERHESRRIDNQLRGRSGRQGDPGRSKFYISLDDDLMRLFGGERLKGMMGKIGIEPGEPITHSMINSSIERAQTKVEERNFDIRKHLLEYDDVLNEQRNFIYSERDAILADEHLLDRVYATIEDYITELFQEYKTASKKDRADSIEEIINDLKSKFGYSVNDDELKTAEESPNEVASQIIEKVKSEIAEKEKLTGKENLNYFIRFQYVNIIDKAWLDHLETLEALREAVYLRSYGQKNPLTEYKNEGFDIFDGMIGQIRYTLASRIALVKVSTEKDHSNQDENQIIGTAQHSSSNGFANMQAANPLAGASRPEGAQVVRVAQKVGRNDPCSCGSGKKYKHCCGR